MLVKVFVNSMRIISCIIKPATDVMYFGMFLVSDPALTPVGFMLWEIGREMVALGYAQIAQTIKAAAEEFAKSLLPKVEIGLKISFTFESDFMKKLVGIYKNIKEIQEKIEKVQKAIKTLESIRNAIKALASGQDCAFWGIVSSFL
jgi:hypothetical protein